MDTDMLLFQSSTGAVSPEAIENPIASQTMLNSNVLDSLVKPPEMPIRENLHYQSTTQLET